MLLNDCRSCMSVCFEPASADQLHALPAGDEDGHRDGDFSRRMEADAVVSDVPAAGAGTGGVRVTTSGAASEVPAVSAGTGGVGVTTSGVPA